MAMTTLGCFRSLNGLTRRSPATAAERSDAPASCVAVSAVAAPAAAAPWAYSEHRSSTKRTSCQCDSRGRIKRSAAARDEFKHSNPCPAIGRTSGSCPGYVIDYVHALEHGGSVMPRNMQWQNKGAAKAKDRIEQAGCARC